MPVTIDGSVGILSPDFEPNGSTVPTNGLYLPTTNTIAWATNSTEKLRLDASGNLGLGVTPSGWEAGTALQFGNNYSYTKYGMGRNYYYDGSANRYITSAASGSYQISGGGAHVWSTAASGTAGNAISFTQAMTLDASGNLGVGLSNPTVVLEAYSTTAARVRVNGTTNLSLFQALNTGGSFYVGLDNSTGSAFGVGNYSGVVWNNANTPTVFATNNTERARIDSSGNLLVGQTSASSNSTGWGVFNSAGPNWWCYAAGTSTSNSNYGFSLYSTGASAYRFIVGYGGTISATTTTISGISDQRLKENIRDLDDGLATILALKPRKFDWKAGKGKDIKNDRGFIAQEFEEVFPDLIDQWADPAPEGEEPYKAVRADLIPSLVKAIQELTQRLEALEAK